MEKYLYLIDDKDQKSMTWIVGYLTLLRQREQKQGNLNISSFHVSTKSISGLKGENRKADTRMAKVCYEVAIVLVVRGK